MVRFKIIVTAAIAAMAFAAPSSNGDDATGSGDRADIAAWLALGSTVSGDTYTMNAGTFSWTSTLNVTKAVNIIGAGIDSTIIEDDATANSRLLSVTLVANQTTRLSGFSIVNGSRVSTIFAPNGIIYVAGDNEDNRRILIDNIKMTDPKGEFIVTHNAFGVIADCTFIPSDSQRALIVYNKEYDDGEYGHGSFVAAPNYGTDEFMFLEDNVFDRTGKSLYGMVDSFGGARWVARYNTLTRGRFASHGTESDNPNRGTRAVEIYGNTLTNTGLFTNGDLYHARSGSAIVYDNTCVNANASFNLRMDAYRLISTFSPWGGSTGTSSWDVNDDANNPYETGTATSGSGSLTLVDSSKAWSTDQWVGYTLNVTAGASGNPMGIITGNTSTTITVDDAGGFGAGNMVVSSGDTYEINKVIYVLDQPGRARGSLVSGGAASTPPVGWNDQVDEPIWAWGNTRNGSSFGFFPGNNYVIVSGEHYNNVADYDAAVAAGLSYTPYTYPHPLRSSGGASYTGRLRFNGTGAKPVRTDGTGQPLIFDQ